MSEESVQLPSIEQIDSERQKIMSSLGILEYEWRQLSERYNAIGERLSAIEADKKQLSEVVGRLDYTRTVVEQQNDENSNEEVEGDGESDDQDTAD